MIPVAIAISFLKTFTKRLTGILLTVFKTMLTYWKISLPVIVSILAIWYHVHQVDILRQEVALTKLELETCQDDTGKLLRALQKITTQIQTEALESEKRNLEFIAQTNDLIKKSDKERKELLKKYEANHKIIPNDCRGALDWLKQQKYGDLDE